MNTPGGKRRSLLASAIESIGSTPPPSPPGEIMLAEAPLEEQGGPSFLARRGVAFDEIARTVKRPTIRLKPSECSIWPGNARDYDALGFERCETLIASIQEEGCNREPVVIRRTPNAPLPYELIVGTRRHFSVAWLNANNHSEIDLIARIETLDDEAAFRLADIENREREDVTDLERARNYLHAVDAYYNGVRSRMAERLTVGKQNLHNLLQLAELPDEIVAAYAAPGDLRVRHGMRLAPLVKDDKYRDAIISAAIALAREQEALRASGNDPIDGAKVCERLANSARVTKPQTAPRGKSPVTGPAGKTIGQVLSDTKAKGLTINIMPEDQSTIDEILEALRPVIERAKFVR